ncbi:MAG: hypothetical protein LBM96_05810 [Methanobrevibacter sp.]|jgi:hypothetical protein|nr:hypothetical protein [Candidatus Methanoflexus mossambicus]
MSKQYISIKQILDNLTYNELLKHLTIDRVIVYSIDFIRIMGVPELSEKKIDILEFDNYRCVLPCDFEKIIQIRLIDDIYDKPTKALRSTTNSFDLSTFNKESKDFTYRIQGNVIVFSKEKGKAEIAYKSMPLDEDGYPLLYNNSSFTRALELYITKAEYKLLFDLGKLTMQSYEYTCREYAFAAANCRTEMNMPTIDEAQSIFNASGRLVRLRDQHATGYKHNGQSENLKIH